MTLQDDLPANPKGVLFDVLDGVRTGMLGLAGGDGGLQPMTHFPDAKAGVIWFISSTETDLVSALGTGKAAQYVVIAKDHDAHISLRGTLHQVHNAAKLDALWGPFVAAWFEGGRDDPRVALLRFDPEIGEIWASSASTLKVGFEVIRANLDATHQPDIGTKATVHFATAA
jgi:general stress protein 26